MDMTGQAGRWVTLRQFCGYDAQSTPRLTLRHENTGVFVHSVLADVEGSLEATLNETGAVTRACVAHKDVRLALRPPRIGKLVSLDLLCV